MQYITIIITFLLGFFAQKIADLVYKKCSKKISVYQMNKKVKLFHEDNTEKLNIMPIATGIPHYDIKSQLDLSVTDKKNILAFPDELRSRLPESAGKFADRDNLFKSISLPNFTKEDVENEIRLARYEVAELFINRDDGCYFNGEKYGVYYSDGFSRTCDEEENPILHLKLFNTDFFTHKVLSKLLENTKSLFDITIENLNNNLNVFRTSIGINIIIEMPATNQILFTLRSSHASYSKNKTWIYVSVTEALTITDYDKFVKRPDIKLCIKRGLYEELGISEDFYDESSIRLYEMFFEKNFFQDGIVASVSLNKDINMNHITFSKGKDYQLEVKDIYAVNLDRKSIKDFFEINKEEMRPQTIYALNTYLSRKNIMPLQLRK